jgi:hypothetical protein
VRPDGTLAQFAHVADLPKGLLGQGCTQVDPDTVVIAGGLDATSNTVGDALVVRISPSDGTLSFTAGPPLADARYHLTLSSHGGWVYAIGGLQQQVTSGQPHQALSQSVERASFDGTSLGAWERLDDLPLGLTHHAAVVDGEGLYLVGGVSTSVARTQILRATFTSDGKLSPFAEVGLLPEGRATAAALLFNHQLYLVAGSSGPSGPATATVERASLGTDGGVGVFEQLASLPTPREHAHHVPRVGATLYSVGGSAATTGTQNDVYAGTLR